MSRACSTCGSSDIDFDPSRGDTVCTNCGSVLEESVIVSEVTFQENSAGGSSVIGQFVSNEGNKVGQGLGFRPGLGRESRTVTLANGKRRLQAIANQLQLNNHCIESAYMFFKLAVSKRLTKGRRSNHIAAACLYLVCRTEKTPHLLIDFSDVLQVEVMVLGRIFLKLQHELCINLPVIDPCLYIHRFSHQFQLEDKEHDVTNTALRLVSRMKRDWIQYGRRPSGLCGAALLVAARLHGFNRTVKQVVKIVRLSNTTIRKRLTDFQNTPSGKLTIDEFNTIDLEEEQDPPCFTKNRQRLKQQQMGEINGLDKPALAHELEALRNEIEAVLTRRSKAVLKNNQKESLNISISDEPDAVNKDCIQNNEVANVSFEADSGNCSGVNTSSSSMDTFIFDKSCDDHAVSFDKSCDDHAISFDKSCDDHAVSFDKPCDDRAACFDKLCDDHAVSGYDDSVLNSQEWQEDDKKFDGKGENENCSETVKDGIGDTNEDDKKDEELGDQSTTNDKEDDLDDLDDDELDGFILTAPEVEVKTKVWMDENKDYLEKLQEKEEREALEREKEDGDPTKKKRRKPYKKRLKEKANSVGEAVEKMLIEKKISHKINYDVLRNLNKENELKKPSTAEPEALAISEPAVSGLLHSVQLSIPVRYKGRKRDKNILPRLPTKRVKFSDSITEEDMVNKDGSSVPPGSPLDNIVDSKSDGVVVESGPVDYDELEQEYVEEEDEDVHLNAAQLMSQEYGQGDMGEYGEYDGY